MNESMQGHHVPGGSGRDGVSRDQRPYWKRAHRDWRIWVAVLVMIAGMIIYVMTDDFALLPRSRPQQPVSGAPGK
jgi:hypothetical protein